MSADEPVRINKYLSQKGYCSRREADRLISEGKVTVNGKVPEMGLKVTAKDEIRVQGKSVAHKEIKPVYLAFNKPVGIVCTTDSGVEKDNIIDFIGYPERIYPVGRLDKMSEGLILLSNDGEMANKILKARNRHEKEYIVTVDKAINPDFVENMARGVPILNTVTRKCQVTQIDTNRFRIVLTQGLNRQIRRMCEHFGYRVRKLVRVRIINIRLDVRPGQWRHLTTAEIKTLHRMTKGH